MNDDVIKMTAELTAILARNSASYVFDKVKAAKARKNDQETIKELEDIISNLIEDKNDLQRIAQVLSQELASQKITDNEIEYITNNVLPLIDKFVPGGDQGVETIKSLLSPEILRILQMLGFNYKDAVGEPLTKLVKSLIEKNINTFKVRK
ncbi:MAG: hypothetical protein ACRDFB_00270 [Rhabdochlamydiaceae bacterium]